MVKWCLILELMLIENYKGDKYKDVIYAEIVFQIKYVCDM